MWEELSINSKITAKAEPYPTPVSLLWALGDQPHSPQSKARTGCLFQQL